MCFRIFQSNTFIAEDLKADDQGSNLKYATSYLGDLFYLSKSECPELGNSGEL